MAKRKIQRFGKRQNYRIDSARGWADHISVLLTDALKASNSEAEREWDFRQAQRALEPLQDWMRKAAEVFDAAKETGEE
jgi:hypothetical protein